MIVQHLRAIQNLFGYLPDADLQCLSKETGIAPARIEEVASFFPGFRQERDRPSAIEVRVCRDMTCHHRGAPKLLAADGLKQLGDDAGLQSLLEENAPQWSRDAGRQAPPLDLCRVIVEGVSCLGRCDRAPAVWVERSPMPAGEHAWVFARRPGETIEQFRARLDENIRAIAAGTRIAPDSDAKHEPHTNGGIRYTLPVLPKSEEPPEHPPLASANWKIDAYAKQGWPRDYRAAKEFVEFLVRIGHRCVPRPPLLDGKEMKGKDLDKYVEKSHPYLWKLYLSGLLGMGGAGVAAYQKWLDVWRQRSAFEMDHLDQPKVPLVKVKPDLFEKYIVANGDESEPGTFKDRELMLRMPHLVVEGVILAGLMTGATAGYIYVRHEYLEQIHALEAEIARAQRLGACGPDVFGTGRPFPVQVYESPGGYICGEQSALIEAMEDKRSQPRNRPPELATNGLRDKPTVVNNVETLAWAPAILLGANYAAAGWKSPADSLPPFGFKGRRLFSISGNVNRPGVYEVPVGIPLGELLDNVKYCGGIVRGKPLKAIAPSGPSSGLLPAMLPVSIPAADKYEKWLADAVGRLRTDEEKAAITGFAARYLPPGATALDIRHLPLDLSFFRNINGLLRLPAEAMLGAGITVFAEGADILGLAVNFTRFFRNESCGKCVPCRIGSQKLYQIGMELLAKRSAGNLTREELFGASKDDPTCVKADVKLLGDVLQPTSICGLGYVAPIPLGSALAYFGEDLLGR